MALDSHTVLQLLPLITAGIGYLGGLLTDPLKAKVGAIIDRRSLRRALYAEIALNHSHLFASGNTTSRYPEPSLWITRAAYSEALKRPLLFYALPECSTIALFYAGLARIESTSASPERDEQMLALRSYLRSCVQSRQLSERLLEKRSPFPRIRFFRGVEGRAAQSADQKHG
jgi:hypothetical protein